MKTAIIKTLSALLLLMTFSIGVSRSARGSVQGTINLVIKGVNIVCLTVILSRNFWIS